MMDMIWVVVSIKYFWNLHPYLWKILILTSIFQRGLKPPTNDFLAGKNTKTAGRVSPKRGVSGLCWGGWNPALLAVGPRGLGGCSKSTDIYHSQVTLDICQEMKL